MHFIDYVKMSFKNLIRQKLRSLLTIFAIVIGATSVTIMLTVVYSAKSFITNQFESNGTFQQVEVSPQQSIKWGDNNGGGQGCQNTATSCTILTDTIASGIAQLPHVVNLAKELQVQGFSGLFYGSTKLQMQQMVAYDANGVIKNDIIAGRDINASDSSGVITITSDYANALGFKHNYQALIGKTVTLHSQNWYSGVGSDPVAANNYRQQNCNGPNGGQNCMPPPTDLPAKIVGIANSNGVVGNGSYIVRVPLDWAKGMDENQQYNVPPGQQNGFCGRQACPQPKPVLTVTSQLTTNGYTDFIVKVDKSSNAAAVATNISQQFKVGAASAEVTIKQQLKIFNILGLILGGIGGLALIVAAVGIINTMVMSILERTKEIGLMRAVGAKRSTINRLFTFEASLLGLFGGGFGLLIGYLLTLVGNPILNHQFKTNSISSNNILSLPTWLIIGVLIGTTFIGMLAGLYPARRAAKLDPVEALRYE